MLGEHKWVAPTTLYTQNISHFSGNKIINCTFRYAEASPLLHLRRFTLVVKSELTSQISAVVCTCKHVGLNLDLMDFSAFVQS